jgi:chromate reductase
MNMVSSSRDVAVFVGSLRKESINLHIARSLIELAPAELKLDIVPVGQLPIYNEDLELEPPESWIALRHRVRVADAVLFVTPEYNRSVRSPREEPRPHSGRDGKAVTVTRV